jgi:hypothetical protein
MRRIFTVPEIWLSRCKCHPHIPMVTSRHPRSAGSCISNQTRSRISTLRLALISSYLKEDCAPFRQPGKYPEYKGTKLSQVLQKNVPNSSPDPASTHFPPRNLCKGATHPHNLSPNGKRESARLAPPPSSSADLLRYVDNINCRLPQRSRRRNSHSEIRLWYWTDWWAYQESRILVLIDAFCVVSSCCRKAAGGSPALSETDAESQSTNQDFLSCIALLLWS